MTCTLSIMKYWASLGSIPCSFMVSTTLRIIFNYIYKQGFQSSLTALKGELTNKLHFYVRNILQLPGKTPQYSTIKWNWLGNLMHPEDNILGMYKACHPKNLTFIKKNNSFLITTAETIGLSFKIRWKLLLIISLHILFKSKIKKNNLSLDKMSNNPG